MAATFVHVYSMQDRQIAGYFVEEPDPPAPLPFLEAANDLVLSITIADAISLYAELVVLMEN